MHKERLLSIIYFIFLYRFFGFFWVVDLVAGGEEGWPVPSPRDSGSGFSVSIHEFKDSRGLPSPAYFTRITVLVK